MALGTFNNGESNASVRTKINAAITAVNALTPTGFTALPIGGAWNAETENWQRKTVLDADKTVTISNLTPGYMGLLFVTDRVADSTLTIITSAESYDLKAMGLLNATGDTMIGIIHVGANKLSLSTNKLGATTTPGGGGLIRSICS